MFHLKMQLGTFLSYSIKAAGHFRLFFSGGCRLEKKVFFNFWKRVQGTSDSAQDYQVKDQLE